MNLIGFFCLAWALLACDQDEGKDNPGVSFPDYGEVLAFPGAEGYGRHATGGRTGEVYQVTTLADSGRGSLRDAVSKPNRIIRSQMSIQRFKAVRMPYNDTSSISAFSPRESNRTRSGGIDGCGQFHSHVNTRMETTFFR